MRLMVPCESTCEGCAWMKFAQFGALPLLATPHDRRFPKVDRLSDVAALGAHRGNATKPLSLVTHQQSVDDREPNLTDFLKTKGGLKTYC